MSFPLTLTDAATFIDRAASLPIPHRAALRGLDQPCRTLEQALGDVLAGRERAKALLATLA
jgi:hypothetical protein